MHTFISGLNLPIRTVNYNNYKDEHRLETHRLTTDCDYVKCERDKNDNNRSFLSFFLSFFLMFNFEKKIKIK